MQAAGVVPVHPAQGGQLDVLDVERNLLNAELAALKPAFAAHGSVTAGNSSQMSDGAAMLLLDRKSVV